MEAGGNLAIAQAVTAAGNTRLAASGTLSVAAAVGTSSGDLSAIAAGTLSVAATGSIANTAGSIDLQSSGGAISMVDGAVVRTDADTIRAQAATDVTLGLLDARTAADRAASSTLDHLTWGSISVVAGGSIADNAGETANDLIGYTVRLQAGNAIATAGEQLEIEAGQLSAVAGAGGMFLSEATGLEIQQLAALGVQRVGSDGSSAAGPVDAVQGGLASGGALVVQTLAGSIFIGGNAAVSAAGNLLLKAEGPLLSDLSVGSAVSSSGGSISLLAARDLALNANVSTAGSGKTIDLFASRHFAQLQGTSVASTNGNVSVEAGENATLESIAAGTAAVYVSANNILDGDAAGDSEVDLVAATAQLAATGALAAAGAALEIQVATLSASAASGLFLTESDGLTVDSVQVNVDRVGGTATTTATLHAAQEDLSAPTVVLSTLAGDLRLNAGTGNTSVVNGGAGNVRLEAADGQVIVAASINAGTGHATVLGATGVSFEGTGTITTSGGTVDVEASGGAVTMADGTLVLSNGGAVRLKAFGDVTVGMIDAGAGSVSLAAGGSILDHAGDTSSDVLAGALRLQASVGIGSGSEALETAVAQLSASAGADGVFLLELDAVAVTRTAAVSVNRVDSDGTTLVAQTDATQDGISSGGAAVLRTAGGTLTTTAQGAIAAAGNVYLLAAGAASDLVVGAAVSSGAGSMSLRADRDTLLNGSLSTAGSGKSINVRAGRDLVQAQGTDIITTDGGIALSASGNITLESLAAGSAGIYVSSGGTVTDGDAAGDSEVDLVANRAWLLGLAGIGAAGAELETTLDVLRASGNFSGLFLTETDALALDLVSVSYQNIDATGAATNAGSGGDRGLMGAPVVLRTLNGGISSSVNTAISATGNLLLQAGGATADITLAGTVSATGAASVLAGRDVTLSNTFTTTAAGSSIDIQAQGRIDAQQGSAISASNANVQLLALGGSVTLESIAAGTGTVRISGTSIVDGDAGAGETEVDIAAGKLLLTASSGAGTGANPLETNIVTLSVSAGGIVGIVESNGLVLDTITTSVDRVGVSGVASATAPVTQSNVSGTTVTLRTLSGPLVGSAGGAISASGNLLLKAAGGGGDITLSSAVASSGGNISIDAGRDVTLIGAISTATAGKTVDVFAGGLIEQFQGSTLTTNNGHVALAATGVLTLETVSAGTGNVSLSGASVVDGDVAGDSEVDVTAGALRIATSAGGIGASNDALETSIATLSALATGGGLFLTETDALDLAAVSVAVNRVANNGSEAVLTLTPQSHVNGAVVVLRTLAGSLSSQASGNVSSSGNVLLRADGAASDLTLAGTVATTGGHASLQAGRDLVLNAGITTLGRSVDMVAGRNFTQAQGTSVTSNAGNIALQAGGTATLETFNAGTGQLRITAAGIVDGDGGAGETEVDLLGTDLQVASTGGFGTGANPLESTVQTLAAAATGDFFLSETDALTIGTLTVDTQRVGLDGSSASTANAATSGLASSAAVVQAKAGSLTTTAAISAFGNLLLKSTGAASDLTLGAGVLSTGHVTLDAGRDLLLNANVTATTAGRTLVLAAGRDFVQAQGMAAATTDGGIALAATGNATLEMLQAGTGNVRVAAASIVDGDSAGDAELDVAAGGLLLTSGGAIGAGANALETAAATLTLQAGAGAFVTEADALLLGSVGVATQRVATDGVAQAATNATQSALNAGGALVVRTTAGSLSSNAQGSVTAAGNVLLAAGGAASDLSVGAAVTSTGSNISLDAGRDLLLGAGVSTMMAGTLDLQAQRNVTQSQGIAVTTSGGNIALAAVTGTATVETLNAGTGGIRISAGAIADGDAAGDSDLDLVAASAQLIATGAIGASGAALETSVATLAAQASGDLFLTESTALVVGSLTLDVQRVAADGSSASTAHAATSGLGGANVVLRTVSGELSIQQAATASGNLLLQAGGAAGDLSVTAATTAAGALSLDAGRDLSIAALVATTNLGSTIDLRAVGTITLAEGSSVMANDANALIAAGGSVTVESVRVGAGSIRVTGASLLDGDATGDTEVDIVAAQLQVAVTGSVGSPSGVLETTVGTLAISAGGSIQVNESDALVIDTISFAGVNRVGANGGTTGTGTVVQGNVASTGGGIALGAQGDLTLAPAASVSSTVGDVVLVANVNLALGAGATVGSSGLAALFAQGTLALGDNAAVTAGGPASLTSVGNFSTGSGAVVSSSGSTATLSSNAGSLTLGNGNSVAGHAGASLNAQGNLTIGNDATVASSGSTTALVSAAGAIAIGDRSTASGAAGVSASAQGGFTLGASGHLTSLGGTIAVTTQGNLAIGTAATALAGSGNLTLGAAGDLTLGSQSAITGGGGNVLLDAGGNLALGTQAGVTGTTGTVTLDAGGTLALASDADVASNGAAVTLTAVGNISMADLSEVRSTGAGTVDVTSATGTVLMDPNTSALRTGTGDIHVTAEGDIRPGALVTEGRVYLDSRNGRILIQGDLQRNGEDIDLFGDDLVISVPVSSPGGTLRIGPLDAGATVIIGDFTPAGPALQVDTSELALLQDGFAQIVIGGTLANTAIELHGTATPLVFRDPLLLSATGAGGTVSLDGVLNGDSLTIANAGGATTFHAATVQMQGALRVEDELRIDGPTSLSGAGLTFTQAVTGQGGASDTLALSGQGGNIRFEQAVSGLDGLVVSNATDVRFGAGLSLDGDLVIDATGTVTFDGPITLNNGARLIVRGTANVVFASSADFGTGDVLVQTAAIAATGGDGSLRGQGLFTVQGTTAATAITVGATAPAGALRVGDDLLRSIGAGFDALVIGTGAGAVTLADSDFRVTGSPVRVEGSTIAIATGAGGVQLGTALSLHATGAITASGLVNAVAASDISLRSDTAGIAMTAGTLVKSAGGDITLDAASGLAVAGLDARAGGGNGGLVLLRTAAGLVTDANADAGVDVYARGVTLSGLGPAFGGGDVLEVAAPLVRVDTPVGMVVRETGTDGRTYFNVLEGAELRQALVAVGGASRVTTDLEAFVAGGGQQRLASAAPPSSALQSLLASAPAGLAAANSGVQVYLAGGSAKPADPGLTLSERLQSESELSFASGQPAGDGTGVDYWSESLSL